MQVDDLLVTYIANTYYNISPIVGSIKQLPGYDDKNFVITDSANNKSYVLKIVNQHDSIKELTDIIDEVLASARDYCDEKYGSHKCFFVPKLIRTTGNKLSAFVSVRTLGSPSSKVCSNCSEKDHIKREENYVEAKCNIKLSQFYGDSFTVFDMINGKQTLNVESCMGSNKLAQERCYYNLGKVCNLLFVYLRTQQHLLQNLKQIRIQTSFPWQLTTSEHVIRKYLDCLFPVEDDLLTTATTLGDGPRKKRALVESVLKEFREFTEPRLTKFPEFLVHGDLNGKNLLVLRHKTNGRERNLLFDGAASICVIDFQDLQVGQQVIDLAIMILYNVLEQNLVPYERALIDVARWTYYGYQATARKNSCPLTKAELLLIPSLMKLRLCQSLLNGQIAYKQDPSNSYVMLTNKRGWTLLELMSDTKSTLGNAHQLIELWLTSEPIEVKSD